MKHLMIFCLIIFTSFATFANGDPTDKISALIGSGNPTPRKITDIQIVSEKLYIRLGYYSEYTVRYVLWNNSNTDYTDIDYAFPVDYAGGGTEFVNSGLVGDYISESSTTIGWHDDYVKSISFRMNGDELPYKRSEEIVLKMPDSKINKSDFFLDEAYLQKYSKEEQKEILDEANAEYEYALKWTKIPESCRRWFYTQFSIKAHQAITLEVHYSLRNSQTRSTYSGILDQKEYGSRCELSYDFSPAQYWGDEKAWDFTVEIDASDLAIVPDFSINTKGLPLKREGNLYKYTTQNFLFKNSAPLIIEYSLINNIPLPDLLNLRIPNDQYSFSISDEQKKYPSSNLNDMNMSTALVLSKQQGIGEKIIIRFDEPTELAELVLINGYQKNKKTYFENNRVKKVNVTIRGKTISWENKTEDDVRQLNIECASNENFIPISFELLKQHPDVYSIPVSYGFDSFKVTEMELIIKEVYSGTKYDDTCISEIILFKKVDKKYHE